MCNDYNYNRGIMGGIDVHPFKGAGYEVLLQKADFEFQKGGHTQLVVRPPA